MLAALPARRFAVALDLGGAAPDSAGLAALLERWLGGGRARCFLIGGAEGLDAAVLARADHVLSLGPLTWPHLLVARDAGRAALPRAGDPLRAIPTIAPAGHDRQSPRPQRTRTRHGVTPGKQERRPVMLVILDGWGWREEAADNAVRQASTPNFDRLLGELPARLPAHLRRSMSGCPRGRWAIPRSATSTSAPAAW